jgi:hypothetical protein
VETQEDAEALQVAPGLPLQPVFNCLPLVDWPAREAAAAIERRLREEGVLDDEGS